MNPHSSPHVMEVIKPVVAGQFYPRDPETLSRDVQRYIDEADIEVTQKPVLAVLTPHAGYLFSGAVAGYSFRHVQNQHPDTILFLAISHQGVEGGCVLTGKFYETPLGWIPVDEELTQALLNRGEPIYGDASPYLVEHSIEVNLPFVQTVFPHAQVASMLITHPDAHVCKVLGEKVAQAIRSLPKKTVLIVVSSDMSHYPPYDIATRIDREMLGSLESLEPSTIHADLKRLGHDPSHQVGCVMCGGAAMLTAIEAARRLGAESARTLHYQNSGDCSIGDTHRVVGYGSLAIYASSLQETGADEKEESHDDDISFSREDQRELLTIARKSIHAVLHHQSYEPTSDNPRLKVHRGVFVTLKNSGELRGCLGRFDPGDLPLDRLVAVMASQSATHDIRFKPVTADELPMVDIQISVLTPLSEVHDINEIEIGKHGLHIQGRNSFGVARSGTLLPQVATEQGWNINEFLNATCVKAGLEPEAWKDPQTEIRKYGAIIFGDRDFASPPYRDRSS